MYCKLSEVKTTDCLLQDVFSVFVFIIAGFEFCDACFLLGQFFVIGSLFFDEAFERAGGYC